MTMTVMMMEHVTTMTLTIKMATGTRDLVVPGSIMVVLMMMKMATGTRDLVVPGSIIRLVIMMTMATGTRDLVVPGSTRVLISLHHTDTDHTDIAGCRVTMGDPNLFQDPG